MVWNFGIIRVHLWWSLETGLLLYSKQVYLYILLFSLDSTLLAGIRIPRTGLMEESVIICQVLEEWVLLSHSYDEWYYDLSLLSCLNTDLQSHLFLDSPTTLDCVSPIRCVSFLSILTAVSCRWWWMMLPSKISFWGRFMAKVGTGEKDFQAPFSMLII